MQGLMSPFNHAKQRIRWCTFRAEDCYKKGDKIAAQAYEDRIKQIKLEYKEQTGENYDSRVNVND